MRLLLLSATAASLTLHASGANTSAGGSAPGAPGASGQEWSRFLGTNGSGHGSAPGLPNEIKPETCAWRTDLPGTGVSSPIAWGNRIILTAELDTGERAVLCYSLETGKEVWRYTDKFDSHGKHKFNSFASSTPTADKDRIYLAWSSGSVMRALALTHEGKRIWDKEVGPYKENHGSGASPILAGNVLVVSTDCEGGKGGIFGLKPSDGSVVWTYERSSARTPFSTPLTFEQKPGDWRIVISSNPAGLTCLDAKGGKVVWQLDYPSPTNFRAVGSPVKAGDVIFGAVGEGGIAKGSMAAKITGDKAAQIWDGKKGMPYVPTPLVMGEHILLLGDGGILTSVTAGDGKPLWSERVFQSEQAYSTPVCSGDKIVCISRNGTITTVAADPRNFKILGTAKLDDTCDATPAIANGKLIIRTAHKLMCVPGAKAQP